MYIVVESDVDDISIVLEARIGEDIHFQQQQSMNVARHTHAPRERLLPPSDSDSCDPQTLIVMRFREDTLIVWKEPTTEIEYAVSFAREECCAELLYVSHRHISPRAR